VPRLYLLTPTAMTPRLGRLARSRGGARLHFAACATNLNTTAAAVLRTRTLVENSKCISVGGISLPYSLGASGSTPNRGAQAGYVRRHDGLRVGAMLRVLPCAATYARTCSLPTPGLDMLSCNHCRVTPDSHGARTYLG